LFHTDEKFVVDKNAALRIKPVLR